MRKPDARWLAVRVAVIACFAAACNDGGGATVAVESTEGSGAIVVVAESGAFSVDRVEVEAGSTTTITLENRDDVTHTLVVYAGENADSEIAGGTGDVAAGEDGEAVVFFSTTGEHAFRCQIHPSRMSGTFVVR